MIYIAVAVIVAVFVIIFFAAGTSSDGSSSSGDGFFWGVPLEDAVRRAGRRGENFAAQTIGRIMHEGDRMFTNVCIEVDGRKTELDIVIVNKYGVFIIEVKNYKGFLSGGENDFEWQKIKTTDAGNTYEKTVKNPIRQVKRQIFLLARFLEANGAKAWVMGYAYIINANSPVKSEYLLESIDEIARAIHTPCRRMLGENTIDRIAYLFGAISQ